MQAVQAKAAFAKHHGLFRAASAIHVTCNLLSEMAPCQRCQNDGFSRFKSLPQVSHVDFFISHSRTCPPWLKLLAISHYLNLDLAIFSFVIAFILGVILIVAHANSLSAVAKQPQEHLFACLYVWPILIFVAAYSAGHVFSGRSFWFDGLCINQQNLLLKSQALHAVPAFVANSAGMMVLFDDFYFERLWCIYELAVYSKAGNCSAELIPTWMPIFMFYFISSSTLSAFLSLGNSLPPWDAESRYSLFLSVYGSQFLPSFVYYPFLGVALAWLFFQKLQRHRAMLDQMADFDLRNAKCTLETDRYVIEEHVISLFDEALEPPVSVAFGTEQLEPEESAASNEALLTEIRHITSYPTNDQIIDQFNAYVRGPLRDRVLQSMGKEDYLSFKLCFVATLPWFFNSMVYLLGCDGHPDCQTRVSSSSFSFSQYFISSFIFYAFASALGNILQLPLLLLACRYVTELVEPGAWRMLLGTIVCSLLGIIGDQLILAERAILAVVMLKFSWLWLAASLAGIMLQLCLLWCFFLRKPVFPTQRKLLRWSPTRLVEPIGEALKKAGDPLRCSGESRKTGKLIHSIKNGWRSIIVYLAFAGFCVVFLFSMRTSKTFLKVKRFHSTIFGRWNSASCPREITLQIDSAAWCQGRVWKPGWVRESWRATGATAGAAHRF